MKFEEVAQRQEFLPRGIWRITRKRKKVKRMRREYEKVEAELSSLVDQVRAMCEVVGIFSALPLRSWFINK